MRRIERRSKNTKGARLVQKADGFAATVVNGAVTMEDGKHTGATPGQVLKGAAAI